MQVQYFGDPSEPPLLFIHGNAGTWANGKRLIEHFQKDYYLIAPDSRYHGKSSHDGRELSYELMAEDYAHLIDQLELDSLTLIGESDGGIIGLLLAMQDSNKVKRLIALGANIRPDSTAIIASDLEHIKGEIIRREEDIALGDSSAESQRSLALLRLIDAHPNLPNSALKAVHCPTLLIYGERDVIKARHRQEMLEALPKGELAIIKDAEHDVLGTHSEPVIALIEK